MIHRKKRLSLEKLKIFLPYFLIGLITFLIVSFGSFNKNKTGANVSLDMFADKDDTVSVDQISELYIVADLSDALGLASASDTASNYVVATAMYESGQTSAGKLEKPNITDVDTREWVIEYTVQDGESMATIADRYGITTDQIRWSNGLKTTDVSTGNVLYLPKEPGIVYTVKSSDTIASIAEKYGSNIDEITIFNDLDTRPLAEGQRIFIKNGTLPEKERPEYVPPVTITRPVYNYNISYSYTYLGDTSERIGIEVIGYNYYGGGQCVGYATWYRNISGLSNLRPVSAAWGNARNWAAAARAAGFVVDNTPEINAVFQTPAGLYGHVGIVVGINTDGSIVVQEANYNYRVGRITRATIPASAVGNFNYIH